MIGNLECPLIKCGIVNSIESFIAGIEIVPALVKFAVPVNEICAAV
jgi:hypothetical protein